MAGQQLITARIRARKVTISFKRLSKDEDGEWQKKCKKCKEDWPLDFYNICGNRNKKKFYLYPICQACFNESRLKKTLYIRKKRENKIIDGVLYLKCRCSKSWKPETAFNRNRCASFGRQLSCAVCERAYRKLMRRRKRVVSNRTHPWRRYWLISMLCVVLGYAGRYG